ncbi:MAG TPA: hypothetical protein VM711_05210 [Sphingomicrobium sp.]|nr:hypothetical protein [Sphingomicrobium sp.]
MTSWRALAFGLGGFILVCGVLFWNSGSSPVFPILGALVLLTAVLEPIYGRASTRPLGGNWRPTDEKFVDPNSGKVVTVWFDPASGERRYVEDKAP